MKNQYFGDINDYRKYGLVRLINDACGLQMLVAWMLTPNDGRTDGKFISYLDNPAKWARYDPPLFNALKVMIDGSAERQVRLIEETDLLANANFHSDIVPDSLSDRRAWFDALLVKARNAQVVFLDPDNGIEIKSKRYGSKESSKYVYWHEIEALWAQGRSLLIYQHFIRECRSTFIQRLLTEFEARTPQSKVSAFSTPHVVFFLVLQPAHQFALSQIAETVHKNWSGQIECLLTNATDLRRHA